MIMTMKFAIAGLQRWLAFFLFFIAALPVFGVRAAATDALLDAAKREGEIVFYVSMNLANQLVSPNLRSVTRPSKLSSIEPVAKTFDPEPNRG